MRVLGPDEVRDEAQAARTWLTSAPHRVGLLGGGVIGGGWAARFLLNGIDVRGLRPRPGRRGARSTR